MGFYFCLLLIICMGSYLFGFIAGKNKRIVQTVWCAIVLLWVAANRGCEVGADTQTYILAYQNIASATWENILSRNALADFEIGYVVMCKLCSYISASESFFLFWTSLFSILPVSYFIYKYSKSPTMSFVLYVLTTHYILVLGVIRQSIAMGIVLLALDIIIEKKKKWILKALILIVLATLSHTSAILGIVFFVPTFFEKVDAKHYGGALITILFMMLFGPKLVDLILSYDPNYYVHVSSGFDGVGRLVIPICILTAFILFYKKKLYTLDENGKWWEYMMLVALILQVFSYFFVIATREAMIFNFSYLLLIPNSLSGLNKGNRFVWNIIVVSLYVVFFAICFDERYVYIR